MARATLASLSSYAPSRLQAPVKSGSAYYFVDFAGTGATVDVRVYKATTPLSSWSEQDAANAPVLNNSGGGIVNNIDYVVDGTTLHIVTARSSDSSIYSWEYHAFDCSTDQWSTTAESIAINTLGTGVNLTNVSIGVRSDGDVLVFSQIGATANMGTSYGRVGIHRREGGTWTTNIAAGTGATKDTVNEEGTQALMTGNDRFHVLWRDGTTNTQYSTYLSNNTFGHTETEFLNAADIFDSATSWNNGTNEKVRFTRRGTSLLSYGFNDADSPGTPSSWTIVTSTEWSSNTRGVILVDADTDIQYCVYKDNSGNSYNLRSTGADNDTWSEEATDIHPDTTSSVFDPVSNLYLDGSGNLVVGTIYGESSSYYYEEYTVAAGSTGADGAITSKLPTLSGSATVNRGASGAITGLLPSLSSTASIVHHADGAITGILPNLAGTVTRTANADGAIISLVPALAGDATSGTVQDANGAITSLVPSLSGDATVSATLTADGAITSLLPSLASDATVTHFGAGAIEGILPSLAGSATVTHNADGSITALLPSLSGSGSLEYGASGSITGLLPALSGDASIVKEADGAITSLLPTLTGDATAGSEIVANGAITGLLPTILGDATVERITDGSITLPLPTLSANATVIHNADGAITSLLPLLAGNASLQGEASADGAITGLLPSLSSDATVTRNADGAVTLPLPDLAGSATRIAVAAGTITGLLPTLSSEANVERVTDGAVTLLLPSLSGNATVIHNADGAITSLLPSLAGDVDVVGVGATATGAITGLLPSLAGSASRTLAADGAITSLLPDLTADATVFRDISADGAITSLLPDLYGTATGPAATEKPPRGVGGVAYPDMGMGREDDARKRREKKVAEKYELKQAIARAYDEIYDDIPQKRIDKATEEGQAFVEPNKTEQRRIASIARRDLMDQGMQVRIADLTAQMDDMLSLLEGERRRSQDEEDAVLALLLD